ncbi:MAG: hypothetical protein J1F64_07145, partial [Oscillospiraceae bacterium]|nr:hypothetical protein [Oscillospiraceae bacterium]
YNPSENIIKSMSGDSRKVKEYINCNELKMYSDGEMVIGDIDEDEEYYDQFTISEIFYDA